MAARLEELVTDEDGTVSSSRSTLTGAVEANAALWFPALPTAFEKARDATIFTRLETRHSREELEAALDAAPDIDQTFCLSVNNVILVFSASHDEHVMHCRRVLQMLQDRSMRANIRDCVFDSALIADTGIRLEQIGTNRAYLVINESVPRR
jgi:hypothetical protein